MFSWIVIIVYRLFALQIARGFQYNVKVMVIGDSDVGKTSLSITLSTSQFPSTEELSTAPKNQIYHTLPFTISEYAEIDFVISIFDTEGNHDDRMRPLVYPETDVILICFSIDDRPSYEEVKTFWVPEFKHYIPSTPFYLIGTKTDIRQNDTDISMVGKILEASEGISMAKELGAVKYIDVSAKKGSGIDELIEAIKYTSIYSNSALERYKMETSSVPIGGDGYIELGEFRLGVCDYNHFSISSTTQQKTSVIFRSDGTVHDGSRSDFGLWHKNNIATGPSGVKLTNKGITFNDVWCIGLSALGHLSIAHVDGWTADIFRSDGTQHEGPRTDFNCWYSSYDNNVYVSASADFIQFNYKFRIGKSGYDHLSIASDDQTCVIYRADGTIHEGPRTDFGFSTMSAKRVIGNKDDIDNNIQYMNVIYILGIIMFVLLIVNFGWICYYQNLYFKVNQLSTL